MDRASTFELRPPLRTAWTTTVDLTTAVAGANAIYGITGGGRLVALDSGTGAVRWSTGVGYLGGRLAVDGNIVYAYKRDQGLYRVTDNTATFAEFRLVSINPLADNTSVSNIVVGATHIFLTHNQAVVCLSKGGELIGAAEIGTQMPYDAALVGTNGCVVVDGLGQAQMYELVGRTLERRWMMNLSDPGSHRERRPVLITNDLVLTGGNGRTVAYDRGNGSVRWQAGQVGAVRLVETGGRLYAVGSSAQVFALEPSTGATIWARMYIYGTTQIGQLVVHDSTSHLFIGAWVANGGPIHLLAVDLSTGAFQWQASMATAGLPLLSGGKLISYGTSQPARALQAVANPVVTQGNVLWSPNPLRSTRSEFEGSLTIQLSRAATLTVDAVRELTGTGARLLDNARRSGEVNIAWNAGGNGGFTDDNQFGRLVIQVTEDGATPYTVTQLVPVNTLPDLIGHWAKQNIEIMLYRKYLNGYPDQLFRPDNLITRAETCTVIAKTLDLSGPSSGYQTRLTDIATHWARDFIMALEERGIVSGFLESDGTYSFRPEGNMTRAQEARVLVNAYNIPSAPGGFQTKFTDTAGHWAKADIEALEAARYVNGFQEADGTFTYRPEQNLTRAELSTLVVRIRNLTRG